jgi:hypothetical protein
MGEGDSMTHTYPFVTYQARWVEGIEEANRLGLEGWKVVGFERRPATEAWPAYTLYLLSLKIEPPAES